MGYKYPEIVESTSIKFIEMLEEIKFFEENEIEINDFIELHVRKFFMNRYLITLTKKIDDDIIKPEDEILELLDELVIGSILHSLKDKGVLNSYEDETTDEKFFLTDLGKNIIKLNNMTLPDNV